MAISREAVRPFRFVGKHEAECGAEGMIKLPDMWLCELSPQRTFYICKDHLSQDIVLIDGEDFEAKIVQMDEHARRGTYEAFQKVSVGDDGRFRLPFEMLNTHRVMLTGAFDHIKVSSGVCG